MKQKGFTLIELLVVIAIIGILSSVVLASLNSARSKGRDATRVTDIKQLQLAFELYFDSCGQYPAGPLTPNVANGCSGVTLGTFISTIPTDPSTRAAYAYTTGTGNTTYVIGATLENTGSPALANDLDGTQLGTINCGVAGPTDAVFCVKP
jgi:prepilin-type N-terminal cleavage/methylation domain-containing protein